MTGRLFVTENATGPHRYEWGRWLPVLAPPRCPRPRCGAELVTLPTAIQPALFIHGGYGAAERSTFQLCVGCGWTRTATTETINPRHLNDEDPVAIAAGSSTE